MLSNLSRIRLSYRHSNCHLDIEPIDFKKQIYLFKNICSLVGFFLFCCQTIPILSYLNKIVFFQSLVHHTLISLGREMLNIVPSAVRRIYAMPIVSIIVSWCNPLCSFFIFNFIMFVFYLIPSRHLIALL